MTIYVIAEYDIDNEPTGYVKLGYTESPLPASRLQNMQCANPRELRVLAYFDGDRHDERFLKQEFADAKVRGEWFVPDILEMTLEEFRDAAKRLVLGDPASAGRVSDSEVASSSPSSVSSKSSDREVKES